MGTQRFLNHGDDDDEDGLELGEEEARSGRIDSRLMSSLGAPDVVW